MNFVKNLLIRNCNSVFVREIHANSILFETKGWLSYNEKVYPPQKPDEPRRPAFVCHQKKNIKYSLKTLWYIAVFVRGMTVDEAIRQLQFIRKDGARYVSDTIREARDLAVKEHNVEFPSNLWVAESFVGKGAVIRGVRRHAKGKMCRIEYKYSHYFVRLEEGTPPKYYYFPDKSGQELLDDWVQKMRKRKVINSL